MICAELDVNQWFAEFLWVAPQTLRRWECEGKFLPDERTAGGSVATTLRGQNSSYN